MGKDLFNKIYDDVAGHTWYVQMILNRMYSYSNLNEVIIPHIIADIILENEDYYWKIISMLTDNQRNLIVAIAKEKAVYAINSSEFISKYGLKASGSVNTA